MILRIYTDGGCSGNQNQENIGGWGAVLVYGEHTKELHGGMINTTNNRMEMTALLEAFRAVKRDNIDIEVFSDSSYLMNCFREKWYVSWQKNGWKNSKKEPVENRDLWESLIPYLDHFDSLRFYRVKGHVNLASKTTDFEALYKKFIEWNGAAFDFDEFRLVTEMNNRADELANLGIDEQREAAGQAETE